MRIQPTLLLLLVSAGAFAGEPPARQDRFSLGILAGSMFPQDSAYDTAAPEFGLTVAYSPEWRWTRVDLSAFATAGRSSERGVSAVVNWFLTDGSARPFLGIGAGLAWLGVNYALANQVGWHLLDYPETKAHAPFVALAAGIGFAIAVFGGAIGQSRIGAAACEGAARNPGAAGRIQTMMILGLALIESLVLFALLVIFAVVKPMAG